MIEFYSAQQSQAIDKMAINQHGIPSLLLMEQAGLFSYETLFTHYPKTKRILILCGTGNNGGDGFVVGQLALMAGLHVDVVLYGQISQLKNDALLVYQAFIELGGKVNLFETGSFTLERLRLNSLAEYDVIIDALFGTGLDKNRPISGPLLEWVNIINQLVIPVIALDIPSGLDADTGQIHGGAIQADRTCTFITQKPGLYQFNGQDTAGKIHYSRLFLDEQLLHSQTPIAHNHSLKHWLSHLPKRNAVSHKGSTGQVMLIGGDQHMMGAVQMAGLASLKVGAGLVKVMTHSEHGIALTQVLPELMCYSEQEFEIQSAQAKVIAIGPGLGLQAWGSALFNKTLPLKLPKVLDADALTLLAQAPEHQENWVLTPHPGEAARLLNSTTETVQNDRFAAIKAIQKQYGGVVVLKGNATLVFDGERLEMCLAGNAGMATGGMGDVLTGAISGLVAQGVPLFEAACLGVSLHAHAGDILAQQKGQHGLLPTELASTLSQLLTYA